MWTLLAPPGDGRAQAVALWWFPLGGFRFLEPLAPSNQQQHGSQRLRSRPQSAGCTFPRTRRGRSGEFSWSCTDTLEALIVVYDSFNYHSQAWSLGLTRRGRARHRVTRARDLRPQGHLLPRGYAEAFQPSVHKCSRHDLSQPSQRPSFAVAPPRTSTTTRQTPGTEIPMHGGTGQNPVSRRTFLGSTCH